MFERFTDRARRVVVLAQEEARMLNHSYIGTEHILLGLIHEGEGVAAKALESMDISLGAVREKVQEDIGQGQQNPPGHIPFTPRAKKVLELSLREALQLGHNYIGTEHILLGLIREGEERTAVGFAGIEHVFNLDAVDFFYTLSAPLSYDVWGGRDVLSRVIRVVRATRPDVIVTMNPSAVQGNHGNHQYAGRMAFEAYQDAGADGICMVGVRDFEHLEVIAQNLSVPLMLVSYGNPSLRDDARLASLGVRIVVDGHAAYFAAIKATYDCLREQRQVDALDLNASQLSVKYSTADEYVVWAEEYMQVKE